MGAILCYVLVKGDVRNVVAISDDDARRYGCPYCGALYEFGADESVVYRETKYQWCSRCNRGYMVLMDGRRTSDIMVSGYGGAVYPVRSAHPRGTPIFTNTGGIATTNRGPTATVVPTTNRRPLNGAVADGPAGC